MVCVRDSGEVRRIRKSTIANIIATLDEIIHDPTQDSNERKTRVQHKLNQAMITWDMVREDHDERPVGASFARAIDPSSAFSYWTINLDGVVSWRYRMCIDAQFRKDGTVLCTSAQFRLRPPNKTEAKPTPVQEMTEAKPTPVQELTEALTKAIKESERCGFISLIVNGVNIFANGNYASVSIEMGNGTTVSKTIFSKE